MQSIKKELPFKSIYGHLEFFYFFSTNVGEKICLVKKFENVVKGSTKIIVIL